MASRSTNQCELEFTVEGVELKEGNKGPWAKVHGYYTAQDRNKNTLKVNLRFSAFGVLAERCAMVKGQTVNVRLEMGGYANEQGKVWPDYTCQSVSRPWGETGGTREPHRQQSNYQPKSPLDDDEAPF